MLSLVLDTALAAGECAKMCCPAYPGAAGVFAKRASSTDSVGNNGRGSCGDGRGSGSGGAIATVPVSLDAAVAMGCVGVACQILTRPLGAEELDTGVRANEAALVVSTAVAAKAVAATANSAVATTAA